MTLFVCKAKQCQIKNINSHKKYEGARRNLKRCKSIQMMMSFPALGGVENMSDQSVVFGIIVRQMSIVILYTSHITCPFNIYMACTHPLYDCW